MPLFQKRTAREKFDYHRENEKRILAKTAGTGMSPSEKEARSAGWMACARENSNKYTWSRATDAERVAMKTLRANKDYAKLRVLEKSIRARAKAENAANVKGRK